MASTNNVVFEFIANDGVSNVVTSIANSLDGMSMATYTALQNIGDKAKEISNQIVQSASDAEQGWIAFGNGLSNVNGGDLETAKTGVRNLSNELGRSTGDVRQFETTMMNMGASVETAEAGVRAASAAAAGSGKDFATVQSAVVSAMKGRGAALKELGFNIDDYKDKETGAIDTARLYTDMQLKYANAQGQYANSFAANNQKLQNSLAGLRADLGQGAMSMENIFIPALTSAVNGIRQLPGPLKAVAGVGVDAVGTFISMSGEIANVVKAGEGILTVFTAAKDTISGFSNITKVASTTTEAMTLATLANESAEVQAAAAHAGTAGLYTVDTTAKEVDTVATWGLATANWALLLPIIAIIAVVALVVAAVYEAGKQMGWWTNVAGMLAAAMNVLSQAISWLWSILQPVLVIIGTVVITYFQMWYNIIITVIGGLQQLGSAAQNAFNMFANAVGTVLNPLTRLYNKLKPVIDLIKLGGSLFKDAVNKAFGSGGEQAIFESQQYRAMLQSKGITGKVGNTNKSQTVQFNIQEGAVQLDASNMSPSEAKGIMITALESLDRVEGVKLRRTV